MREVTSCGTGTPLGWVDAVRAWASTALAPWPADARANVATAAARSSVCQTPTAIIPRCDLGPLPLSRDEVGSSLGTKNVEKVKPAAARGRSVSRAGALQLHVERA